MNYQWYPGHMMKAKRMMQENMKLIDLVIELVDARIPLSSRNPDIDVLSAGKSRLILLNKADLADSRWNQQWIDYFKQKGFYVLEINAKDKTGMKGVQSAVREACLEKIERNRKRGIINRPVRAMVVGIPNVGKSTFINAVAGKTCAKTGNKPGVTKGKQWIRFNKDLELLDTPGILWPKFDTQKTGRNLAFIGSMNDEILQKTELAIELLSFLSIYYKEELQARYPFLEAGEQPAVLLEKICENRKCCKKGGETDYEKGASLLLEDFRSGRIGRITLERPEETA